MKKYLANLDIMVNQEIIFSRLPRLRHRLRAKNMERRCDARNIFVVTIHGKPCKSDKKQAVGEAGDEATTPPMGRQLFQKQFNHRHFARGLRQDDG